MLVFQWLKLVLTIEMQHFQIAGTPLELQIPFHISDDMKSTGKPGGHGKNSEDWAIRSKVLLFKQIFINYIAMGFIYRITSPSGKFYIGQTTKNIEIRWGKHVSKAKNNNGKPECRLLNNSIRKYGSQNFLKEILCECPNEDLNELEQIFIVFLSSHYTQGGYNISWGGSHIIDSHSEETKDKMSDVKRIYRSYNLPRSVVEVHDTGNKNEGFKVILNNRTYGFLSMNLTMNRKYELAMECYNTLTEFGMYKRKNLRKKGEDDFDIPEGISRRGPNGFSVNKSGVPRKSFTKSKYSREQNLEFAIEFMNSFNV